MTCCLLSRSRLLLSRCAFQSAGFSSDTRQIRSFRTFKGVSRKVPRQFDAKKWPVPVLYGSCCIAACGVLVSCYAFLAHASSLLAREAALSEDLLLNFFVVAVIAVLMDLTTLAGFVCLTHVVTRDREVFGKRQVRCLLAVAIALLLRTLTGLAMPSLGAVEDAGSIGPTLDLRLLSFSFMFFALAGIFEYGRILQEDSDNIL